MAKPGKKKPAPAPAPRATAESAVPVARFDPEGGPLSARVSSGFAQPGSYDLILWEAGVNRIVMERQGNFLNADDDEYELPGENSEQEGRFVQALVTVAITPPGRNYSVRVTVLQDQQVLAVDAKEGTAAPGDAVTRTLWVKLESE